MPTEKLLKAIEELPASALPMVLVAVIKACLAKKVYGERRVGEIATTLESKLKLEVQGGN